MVNPLFYLKSNQGDKPQPIILNLVKPEGNSFRWSIGKKIVPDLWDKETQRPTKNRELLKEAKKVNPNLKVTLENTVSRIEAVKDFVRKTALEHEAKFNKVDFEILKEELDQEFKGKNSSTSKLGGKVTLSEYIDIHIRDAENGILRSPQGNLLSGGTIRSYWEWKDSWEGFLKNERPKGVDFDGVDESLYIDFVNYFYRRDNTPNTVGKNVAKFKAIMRRALKKGYHNNRAFEEFKAPKSDVTTVSLTKEELESLRQLKIEKYTLRRDRDIFLIGCYTALRVSDYSRITKENFERTDKGKLRLRITPEKTKKQVVIPIYKPCEEILQRYNFQVPNTYEHNLNKNIKEACKLAGINSKVEVLKTNGGVRKVEWKEKWELVTSHTARRTGATLLYKAGLPPLYIAKITGHRTETMLLKYINLEADYALKVLEGIDPFGM